jgi:HEAT repeat protein
LSKRAVRDQVRDDMFDRLLGSDSTAARNAAEVLGRFMHPDALEGLELAMHSDSLDAGARAAAATAIGSIGHADGKVILEGALTSGSAAVRASAAAGLRNIRGNVDASALVAVLYDDDAGVQSQAAVTLGALQDQAGVSTLLEIASDPDQADQVRKHACWALGQIGDASAADVLESISQDDANMLVRGSARAAWYKVR